MTRTIKNGGRALGALFLLAAMLTLAACGGGGGNNSGLTPQSSSNPTEPTILHAADYRTSRLNDVLVYSYMGTVAPEPDTFTSTNKEVQTVEGIDGLSIENYWNNTSSRKFDYVDAEGWVTQVDASLTTAKVHRYVHLPANFQIGDRFLNEDSGGPPPNVPGRRFRAESVIDRLEAIQTPAGTFLNCVKVTTTETDTFISRAADGSLQSTDVTLVQHTWYASGIGAVYWSDEVGPNHTERPGGQLVAYQLNGVRSETISPVATVDALPNDANHHFFGSITLHFNEPMREASLNKMIAVITDPEGKTVASSFSHSVDDQNWTFKPTYGALTSSGQYQVRLTDLATDLAGNSVAPGSWAFFVDATPPQLTQVEFKDGKIILTYDESFQPIDGFGGGRVDSWRRGPRLFRSNRQRPRFYNSQQPHHRPQRWA
ncbi:MAG: Ig-like domain-containing protein [Burkholderiales bacterium]|nr:Ig-like domain-containing protein [Burkholderiales bacterium]